jgi:hypothetical protein
LDIKPICIDFGSMGRMGQLGSASHLAATLRLALERLGQPGIVLTGFPSFVVMSSKTLYQ